MVMTNRRRRRRRRRRRSKETRRHLDDLAVREPRAVVAARYRDRIKRIGQPLPFNSSPGRQKRLIAQYAPSVPLKYDGTAYSPIGQEGARIGRVGR
eukprot:709996-Rhodomonas_salina.2